MAYRITGDNFAELLRTHPTPQSEGGAAHLTYRVKEHGEITFDYETLSEGIGVVQGTYLSANELSIAGQGDADLLEIQINLSSDPIHYRNHQKQSKSTPAKTANMVFLSAEHNAMDLLLPKSSKLSTFDIHLPVHLLQRYAGESPVVDRLLEDIAHSRSSSISQHPFSLSPALVQTIMQMQQCTFEGFSRKVYLESKVYELIALLHQQLHAPARPTDLTLADQDKIHSVASYIREHLDHPLTILQLSRWAGLNQTKLKIGFKQIFGYTIFGYLQNIRMARSKSYLLDTNLSVQEIGMLVGYNNTSNFSTAFKRWYGFAPQSLRK